MTAEVQRGSDEELARAAQAGCMDSFEELVCRYEARIFRFVANQCRNENDAKELTQDVFVRAYRSLARFDPTRPFVTWLFTIARRKCIDHQRAQRPATEDALPEATDANDPAQLLGRREAGEDLWGAARNLLPQVQFQALWLRYAEEMDVAQIARVLRRTRTHVKVLLFRARNRLEREFTSRGEYAGTKPAGPSGVAKENNRAAAAPALRTLPNAVS